MIAIFHDMIENTLEVYIDDVVIKYRKKGEHVEVLRKTFIRMRKHHLKMNLKKCAFGVQAGNFLGLLVHQRGIKAKAIIDAPIPRNKKKNAKSTGKDQIFTKIYC